MVFKFLDESEAEKLCESTLESWIASAGYKGCHSAADTRDAVEDTKRWAGKSSTAATLMRYVETSPKEILVVGMRGGYQCFDSTGTDKIEKQPVVYIDLDGRLTRFVRQPHQLHFAPEDCAGLGVNVEAMDNRVALLHEFGHAKQWIANPLFFDDHFKQLKGKPSWMKVSARDKEHADPLMHPTGKPVEKPLAGSGALGQSFSHAIQKRAEEVWGGKGRRAYDPLLNPDAGSSIVSQGTASPPGRRTERSDDWLLTREELEQFQPISGYSVRIEADNIARHEWPICDELGIPRRVNYRDIGGRSGSKASQTSSLLRRQAAAKAAKAEVKVGSLGGKVECPKCKKMVGQRGLNQPCSSFLHA